MKYSLDTQMCDINRNRKNNNQIFKPRLLCAKQLVSQNKNVIVSITGPNTPNAKDCCYAPIIYEQGNDDNSETHNPLKKQKYLLSNSDIPYVEQNHAVYCLCEIDQFVVTGHAHGLITMWETMTCGKRLFQQYLPIMPLKNAHAVPWEKNNGDMGLTTNQYDIVGLMQVNKTVASSLLVVCCHSGELMLLKINGSARCIDLVHLAE